MAGVQPLDLKEELTVQTARERARVTAKRLVIALLSGRDPSADDRFVPDVFGTQEADAIEDAIVARAGRDGFVGSQKL